MDDQRREELARRRKEDLAKQRTKLAEKYKERGIQKMSLAEYEVKRKKMALKQRRIKVPVQLKFILSAPFLVIFFIGLIFLPYIFYVILTSPSADSRKSKEKTGVSQSMEKENSSGTLSATQKP